MKLQKFIESYQRKSLQTPESRSPDRPYIFKTSQSIGTLNSHDQFATDRSFVVKQQNNARAQQYQLQHLKQLCTSQSSKERKSETSHQLKYTNIYGVQSGKMKKQNGKCSDMLTINEFENAKLTLGTLKVSNSLRQLGQSIIFQNNFQSQDCLYEQAPSSIEKVYVKEQDQIIEEEISWFYSLYSELISQVSALQTQNLALEQELLSFQGEGVELSKNKALLSQQVCDLREYVGCTIQQNIQIQNKIKQILLRQQMQRMKFFQSSENILNSIDKNIYKQQSNSKI